MYYNTRGLRDPSFVPDVHVRYQGKLSHHAAQVNAIEQRSSATHMKSFSLFCHHHYPSSSKPTTPPPPLASTVGQAVVAVFFFSRKTSSSSVHSPLSRARIKTRVHGRLATNPQRVRLSANNPSNGKRPFVAAPLSEVVRLNKTIIWKKQKSVFLCYTRAIHPTPYCGVIAD